MDNKEAAHTLAAASTDDSTTMESGTMTARRRLLFAGLAGTAGSLIPWLSGRASATSSTTPSTAASTEPAATTTTAPPKRPTDADIELLDAVQSFELAARDLYDAALTASSFDAAVEADVRAIREAHEEYGSRLAGVVGRNVANTANASLIAELAASFRSADAATAAAELEDRLVATHVEVLSELEGTDAAAILASIATVESRMSTLLRAIAGVSDLDDQIAAGPAEPLTVADYPLD